MPIAIELIPDPDLGGFTARVPGIPAYGEGRTDEEALADPLRDSKRRFAAPLRRSAMDFDKIN